MIERLLAKFFASKVGVWLFSFGVWFSFVFYTGIQPLKAYSNYTEVSMSLEYHSSFYAVNASLHFYIAVSRS